MSAQHAKKKRIGSRRKAVNQIQIAEDNERPLTDTSAAQSSTSGKTSGTTEVANYQDGLAEVPPNWPSPELKENKRKFGSRRKQKGLHVGDFATVLHNKEDVEGVTDSSEITETIQASMEIQTQNVQEPNQEFLSADSQLLGPQPHCDSSEFKDSSGIMSLGTDGECSRTNSENLTEDNDETSFQSEEICISSPEKSGLSLSETLAKNAQPFMISVDPDLTDEANDTDLPEQLSEKECEGGKNDSELLRHMADLHGHHFQSESPKVDDSWPQTNADLTDSGEQKVSLPTSIQSLEDKGQNEHLDLQVDGNSISVEAGDRIHAQHSDSNANHEIMHSEKSLTYDVTVRATEEAKIMFQSELSTDLSATIQDDLSPADKEVVPRTIDTFSDVEKEDIMPSEVNVTHCQDENIGVSAKERVLPEMEQSNSSPEAKQNPLLPVPDYIDRFIENTVAQNNNNEPTATTAVYSEMETEMQEDSMEPTLKDMHPVDEVKEGMQTVLSDGDDDATEHFCTDLTMDGIQIDPSHFTEMLEESRTDVSANKDGEELNCENKQDGNQTEATALGANVLNDTKNTQVGGADRADTEQGGVYKTEDQADDETKSQALDSDVQANLDLPPTQLQQMDSISNLVGGRRKLGSSRKKKLKPHTQDTDLFQQPAEEATGSSDDHEPLETTLSLASETELSDQAEEIAHGVTHGDTPELEALDLLSSATSNQQSAEVRQGLHGMFSATEGKERGEDSNSFWQDENLQLLASESQMESTNKEASAVLMITTDKSNPEKQSDVKCSSDLLTLSEEDMDHVNLPGSKEFLFSVDGYGKVDDKVEKLPVDDSFVLQSDSSLQSSSVVEGESIDPTLAETPSDQVKESMQTDILDDASEYFSTDLTMGGMQMDQSHFIDMLEEFSSVHSGTETHGKEDEEFLRNEHSASASPPTSVIFPIPSEIYISKNLAVTENGTDNALIAGTKESFPLVDGKGDYKLEDVNVCDLLSKTNCLEADSERCRPNSENHQDHFGGEGDFQGEVPARTSPDDLEKSHSHTRDLSSHHSENSPINFDGEGIKASQMHDASRSVENEISDTCTSESGFETSIDVSVSKEEELNCESKQEGNQTEVNDFGAFPQTGDVSRRKLGSSRKKKLKPHAQDTDSSQQPAEETTGSSDDHEPLETTLSLASETELSDQAEEIAHGVTHGDTPELEASDLLSSATSNQQSAEVRQGLHGVFSATEGKEREEDSNSFWQDENLQLLASESQMEPTNKEASAVLMITTGKSNPENQSGIKSRSDPATLSEEDTDHAKMPEGRGFPGSVDSYGEVDEDMDKTPVDGSLVPQSDPSLQSVIDGESAGSVPGEEILLSENTVTGMEIEESSNTHDGDRKDSRCESVTTDLIQGVEADSHPSFENSLGQNITVDHALVEFVEEVGMSINMQGSGRDGIVENTEDLAGKTSAQEKTEVVGPFGAQDNSREEPTGDVPEEVQPSRAEGACSIEQIHFDNCENLQTQTKQKRRKMGSTRRANFNRNQEGDDSNDETKSTQADPNELERVKEVDERPSCRIPELSHSEHSEAPTNPQNTVSDNSVQSDTGTSICSAVVEGKVSSVIHVKADDIKSSERNSDAVIEELQPDDLMGAETSSTLNREHATITDWSFESVDGVTQGAHGDEDRLESVLPDRLLESAATLIVASNLEQVKSESEDPNSLSEEVTVDEALEATSVKPEAKRRKMGSTRKSLASRREGEDVSRKQGEDREATEAAKNVQGINTGALETEDNELAQPKVIVLETVLQSCASESYSRPQATAEEDQLARSFAPQAASTSPQPDAMPETAAGGRRRKLGSHRKSHGYQRNRGKALGQKETGDSQTEASANSPTNDGVTKAAVEKSQSLDKISEDEGDKKTPSNTTAATAAEQPNLLQTSTQETTAQHPSTKRPGSQESQKTLSLATNFTGEHSGGVALPSKRYNVILIGDSSVGKTSFMKRVQTGKFSLDLPASVGTDSCISSVLVDGKHVVLQLWDTAGQERFHSITRQIFHKAQAFLLMYDITSSQSFSDISYWANCIQESASDDVTILLVGNKSDSGTRQVKSQDGEILAKEYNFQFMECSAATGHNVTQSLETVARVLSEKCYAMEEAMLLRQEPLKKKSSGCC